MCVCVCDGQDYTNCKNLYFNDPLRDPNSRICVETCPKTQLDIVCNCGACGTGSNETSFGGALGDSTTPGVVPIEDLLDWSKANQALDANPEKFTMNLMPGSRKFNKSNVPLLVPAFCADLDRLLVISAPIWTDCL